jgi:hypothetical protein
MAENGNKRIDKTVKYFLHAAENQPISNIERLYPEVEPGLELAKWPVNAGSYYWYGVIPEARILVFIARIVACGTERPMP